MVLDQKVRSIMATDVRTVSADATMLDACRMLDEHPFHHLPVVRDGRLLGILSTVDLARLSFEGWIEDRETREAWLARWPVHEVMTALPDVLHPEDPVRKAAELLGDGMYHGLPVVDGDRMLVGIVTTTDLVRLLAGELRG